MALKVAVCDDDQAQREAMTASVMRWSAARQQAIQLKAYPSAEAFLFDYDAAGDGGILLLDVEMGAMSGIELAKVLRRDQCRAEIIFLTSHTEFIGEGYEVDALHYLIKPVGDERLFGVLDKAAERAAREPACLIISTDGQTIKLYESEIISIEALLHHVLIVTSRGEYKVKERISDLEERLSAQFFRCHRSYIVSLSAVRRISKTEVLLENGASVPLARGKYDDIHRAYIGYYEGQP